ncbi:hypothetical protein D3C72_1760700 [compost metagenome]
MIEHFTIGNAELFQQQPDNRRSVGGCGVQGNFSHGLYPEILQSQEYNQLEVLAGSILGRASHLSILLAMAQPAVQQWADMLRPARQQRLSGITHGR